MNWEKLTEKKTQLDGYRPLPPDLVKNLEQWFIVELTYTSNAIEGNTLTRKETAVVVEKGLTVSGKSLVEHLEATNHASALQTVLKLADGKTKDLTEDAVLDIHETILKGIDDGNAGHYRTIPVRISGSMVILPNPVKVPDMMTRFTKDITGARDWHPVALAAEAHYQLVTIHPFVDGNGRTARLLMNLILMQNGYPPALIRKRDRLRYIKSLEQAQLGGSKEDYYRIVAAAVDRSFDVYLKALSSDGASAKPRRELLRIGQLAKRAGETNATLRFWTKEGLLEDLDTTDAGYQLYDPAMAERVQAIRRLQGERYTLKEIKGKLSE
ncbi:MAG: MerR family transcriptional regulator [Verrucomicrobia bacterium]|jgi:Fic family protein|nr:MerR family transcriptional regulator [Verrucomicrobiota bacterium]